MGIGLSLSLSIVSGDPTPWSPLTDVSTGLGVWLDAEDPNTVSLSASKVTAWADKSGNARHYSQAVDASRPTYTASAINGRRGIVHVRLLGEFLDGPDLSALTAGHIFCVCKVTSEAVDNGVWTIGSAGAGNGDWYPFSGTIYNGAGSTTRRTVGDPTPSLETTRLVEVVSTGSEWTFKLDGAELATDPTNTVGFSATQALGKNRDGGFFGGAFGEFLIYVGKLSAGDRAELVAYLNAKWGTTAV